MFVGVKSFAAVGLATVALGTGVANAALNDNVSSSSGVAVASAEQRSIACPATCKLPTYKLTPSAKKVMVDGDEKFSAIKWFVGWRPRDAYPDHPFGRAVDFGVSPYNMVTPRGKKVGTRIATYFQRNHGKYHVKYVIWYGRTWDSRKDSPTLPFSKWRKMADRGTVNANHRDHVHVSVK